MLVRFGVWIHMVQLQDHLHNYMHQFLLIYEIIFFSLLQQKMYGA